MARDSDIFKSKCNKDFLFHRAHVLNKKALNFFSCIIRSRMIRDFMIAI